jgi:predicted dithiol-disulfide oxidoreductase (DUF899 family)
MKALNIVPPETRFSMMRSRLGHRLRPLQKRRALPLGGEVAEDYVFERIGENSMPENVKMSELFGPHDTLILYSFMYGPERELPCPGCTHLLDGLDGAARHVGERAALHIVAKSPIARLAAWAHERDWELQIGPRAA